MVRPITAVATLSFPITSSSCIFRPIRLNSIRRKISGMKSEKKFSRIMRSNQWMPCAPNSSRSSSTLSAIPALFAPSPPSPTSPTHSDVELVLEHLAETGRIDQDGEFWWLTGRKLQAVRDRRNAGLSLRRAEMISPSEYQLAITKIIADAVAISREDLIIETARLFGFDRTGPDLREAIGRQSAILVDLGQFHLDGD